MVTSGAFSIYTSTYSIFITFILSENEERKRRAVERAHRVKQISPEQIEKLIRSSKLKDHISSEQRGMIFLDFLVLNLFSIYHRRNMIVIIFCLQICFKFLFFQYSKRIRFCEILSNCGTQEFGDVCKSICNRGQRTRKCALLLCSLRFIVIFFYLIANLLFDLISQSVFAILIILKGAHLAIEGIPSLSGLSKKQVDYVFKVSRFYLI